MVKGKRIILFLCGMVVGMASLFMVLFVMGVIPSGSSEKNGMLRETESQILEPEGSYFTEKDSSQLDMVHSSYHPEESESIWSGEEQKSSYPEWDPNQVYVGGDQVLYENRIYRAKWWTQNERPGTADVWEDTGQSPVEETSSRIEKILSNALTQEVNPQKDSSVSHKDDSRKVVVYYPSWEPSELSKIRYDIVTHINYAFVIPTAEGGLRPLEQEDTAKQIIADAHANQVKVLLAVGGWSYQDVPLESTFMAATETQEKTERFGNAIIEMCDRYGFDGIDMDWEHPRVDGTSSQQYERLMLYLSEELHKRGKLLTSAVVSGATADGNVYYDSAAHTDTVLQAVDWIHVMAYDGGDGERHSSYEFAVNCASYWLGRGIDSQKIVLGVPFYSRPGWLSYKEILKVDENADAKDVALVNGMEVYYNGKGTIRKKAEYARDHLGGIMIWEVTQDTSEREKSLLNEIGNVMKEGK